MNDRLSTSRTIGPVARALALVAIAGFAFACRPSQTVERQTKDAAIKAQVKTRLASDVGAATVTAIEVNVTNGVVTLAGPVSTEDERQRAEAAARGIEGVTSVNNNLQVTTTGVAAPPPGTTWPPGTAMTPLSVGTTPPSAPPMAMTPEMAMPPPTPGTSPLFVPFPTPTASP